MEKIKVWDKFIRIFHWSIVTIFILNSFLLEDDLHEYLGYALFALLIARTVWGFIGPFNARFASFYPTPTRIKHHLHALKNQCQAIDEGHNALGGMMILFLLAMLFIISISGWMMTLDAFWGEDSLEDIHELASDITLVAVCIHITAVIIVSKISKRNLVKTMITGYRLDK